MWIVEPTSPRGHYPLDRVVKLQFDTDAIDMFAELRTASCSPSSQTRFRPSHSRMDNVLFLYLPLFLFHVLTCMTKFLFREIT